MGAIKTAADAAFRDFNDAASPSSGKYKPQKSVIRSLFETIEIWLLGRRGATITPSAGVLDLSARTGEYLHLGAGNFSSVTLGDGEIVWLCADGVSVITHGASLICLGGVNLTTAAGDIIVLRGEASGVVRMTAFHRASGQPLAVPSTGLESQHKLNDIFQVTSNSAVSFTADAAAFVDSAGYAKRFASLSLQADLSQSGPSGLVTGSEASGTWYFGFGWAKASPVTAVAVTMDITTDAVSQTSHGMANGTPVKFAGTLPTGLVAGTQYFIREASTNSYRLCATPGGTAIDLTVSNGSGITVTEQPMMVLDPSYTAPTTPSGYSYKLYLGAVKNDGSSNLLRTIKRGLDVDYIVGTLPTALPQLFSGALGTYHLTAPTWADAALTTLVPTAVATRVRGTLTSATNGYAAQLAPNSSYGGSGSTTNPCPVCCVGITAVGDARPFDLQIESANLKVASQANTAGWIRGWKEAA
jgi:hypothetical protein